jgi:DHA2 family multidrug resistance protein
MTQQVSLFKPGVGEWLIRVAIFMLLLPNLVLFGISTANVNAACGFYGIEPNDAQYSLIALYAGLVSFFPLEKRFSSFFVTKDYLFISLILEVVSAYACYCSRNLYFLIFFRFLEGLANCSLAILCINLIFSRLHTERSREIGYSIVYGILLSVLPFITFITAPFLDSIDYNELYILVMYTFVPGGFLFLFIMKRGRFTRKIPLYRLDWQSFVLYALVLLLITYILVYGQQYNWFSDQRIRWSALFLVAFATSYIGRQLNLKRPYIDLKVFTYRNFLIGFLLIIVLYITRGAFNLTTGFFTTILGLDPIHTGDILLFNIGGTIIGIIISSRLLIYKVPVRWIWTIGFSLLLIYYSWMTFLFDTSSQINTYIIPLIVQGLGTGMLLTAIIIFMVIAVPPKLGPAAVATAVSFRLLGTSISISLLNFSQLYLQQDHFNRFQENFSITNPLIRQRLQTYQQFLSAAGLSPDKAAAAGSKLFANAVEHQAEVKATIDYYYLICWLLILTLILIICIPAIKQYKILIDPIADVPI